MARYELVERIGAGGMAEIFRGKAVAGGGFEKPVAIKRILPHLGQDKRFVELLIAEAKTLSQLRHRNIVQIYDVGLGDDGQYFLVMEFVDGIDLGALLFGLEKAKVRMPLPISLHVVGEVCEALDHAHRARGPEGQALGLVHRDVTPSNVLLSKSGEVKLTDFGIAKRMEEATGHGGVRGKFAFISPEQSRNAHVDARSDVYSLGIVLYEALLGRRLYSHLPDFEALQAVREARAIDPSTLVPELDRELAEIVTTALQPEPTDRYPSAGAFGSTLRTYRYNLASSTGDPALELARLVDRHRRGRLEAEPSGTLQREPTVVRISTAVGFPLGLPLADDELGLARPRDLDEEETRAMGSPESARLARSSLARAFDDGPTRAAGPPAGMLDSSPTVPRGTRRPASRALPPEAALPPGRHGAEDLPIGARGRRPATPTGEELSPSPTGEELSPSPPSPDRAFDFSGLFDVGPPPPVRPAPSVPRPTGNLRSIALVAAACLLCAVIAFVVVGALLGRRAVDARVPPVVPLHPTTEVGALPVVDAGDPIDASPPALRPRREPSRAPRPEGFDDAKPRSTKATKPEPRSTKAEPKRSKKIDAKKKSRPDAKKKRRRSD